MGHLPSTMHRCHTSLHRSSKPRENTGKLWKSSNVNMVNITSVRLLGGAKNDDSGIVVARCQALEYLGASWSSARQWQREISWIMTLSWLVWGYVGICCFVRIYIYVYTYHIYIYIIYIYKLKIVIPFFLSIHLKIQIFAVHHSAFKVAEQGCLTQLCTGGFHKLLRCKSKGKSNNSETAAVLVRSTFKVSLTLQFKGLHSLCWIYRSLATYKHKTYYSESLLPTCIVVMLMSSSLQIYVRTIRSISDQSLVNLLFQSLSNFIDGTRVDSLRLDLHNLRRSGAAMWRVRCNSVCNDDCVIVQIFRDHSDH